MATGDRKYKEYYISPVKEVLKHIAGAGQPGQFPWTREQWLCYGSYTSYSDKAAAKVNNLVKQADLKHTAALSTISSSGGVDMFITVKGFRPRTS